MKSVQTISRNLIDRSSIGSSISHCVLKLERNKKDLQQLEKQFGSYIYEPTTYSLFAKSEAIKRSIISLKNNNLELISALKRERDLKIELFEKTLLQIRSFMEIKNSVNEYCKQLRY
ncbi:hypothetical protein KCTC52924_03219 [Arenibacter antarcticus]|uniref:Uncharacterized protein n=1 Tax=Arenibacter antarcticus TaxID=2040469 RepID=A0ABW5VGM1_9FLAO|nr:hypothetical protein [Arenibacter sp. H213]MCM4166291.1 hypothetical protein [Arenibacter sp. H213]